MTRARRRAGTLHGIAVAPVLVVGLLALLGRGATAGEPTPRAAERAVPAAQVRGRVSDPDGKPLAGATVRVLAEAAAPAAGASAKPAGAKPLVTRTDDEGAFAATGLDGQTFAVRIESPRGAPFTGVGIPAGAQVTVRLRAGHELVGSVSDAASREPLGGAALHACDAEAVPFGEDACAVAITDAEGKFRFAHLPEGAVSVDALAAAHARSPALRADLPLAEDATPLGFRLGPGGRIAGSVVDSRGAPLGGVTVRLTREDGRLVALGSAAALARVTGEDGRFAFDGVPTGDGFRLVADSDRFPARTAGPFRIEAGSDLGSVSLSLREAARIAVRLVEPDERPFAGVIDVWIRDVDAEASTPGGAGTRVPEEAIEDRGGGRFVIGRLADGPRDVLIRPHGWSAVTRSDVTLEAGKTIDLGTTVLERGRVLRGRVTDPDGAPIADAEIHAVFPLPHGPDHPRATSDANGAYELGGLAEGPILLLRASAKGYGGVTRESIPADETIVDFTLEPAGGVEGRVVLERGGSPDSFVVTAHHEAGENPAARALRFARNLDKTFQDPEGRFRLEDLEPGSYTIEARAAGFAPARRSGVVVQAREITPLGKLTLERGVVLSGRVVDAEGGPVATARIQASPVGGLGFEPQASAARGPVVASDDDGRFVLEGLEPGAFTVRALHPGYAPAELRVELREREAPEPIVLQVGSGGTLAGSVREAQGEPLGGSRVMAFANTSRIDARTASTGADGRYEMTRLAPGSYQVSAIPAGSSSPFGLGAKNAVVREGETTVVDFGEKDRIALGGTVRRGAEPLADAELFFLPGASALDAAGIRSARADGFGRYAVALDRPGRWRVVVEEPGRLPLSGAAPVDLDVPDEAEVTRDIVLAEGGLAGTVVDGDGQPVAGSRVVARRSGASDEAAWSAGSMTDAAGAWSIEGLDEGSYDVSASAAGFRPALRAAVSLGSRVDLVLEAGRSVRGRLVDPVGGGIAGAWVTAAPAGGAAALAAARAQTDVNGAFVLTAPVDGPVDLTAIAAGWAPARATAIPDGSNDEAVELRASLGGALVVTALGADGRPRAGLRIAVRPEPPFAGWELARLLEPVPPTDASGVSRVEHLSPGNWVVSIADRHDVEALRASVTEGTERPVVLRLP